MLATGTMISLRRAAVLAIATLMASPLAAHELDTMIGLDVEHSDNIVRLPAGQEIADLVVTPTLRTVYQLEFARLVASLRYTASRTDYRDDTFQDRSDFLGQGSLVWSITDSGLDWSVYHTRSRLKLDSRDAEIPSNETVRSVTRTGPALHLRFGKANELRINADFVKSTLDTDQAADSTQRRYAIDLRRQLSTRTALGLLAEYSDVRSDLELLDYRSSRYGLRLDRSNERSQYHIDVGRNRVEREIGPSASGTLLSLSASTSTVNATWQFSAVRELTDSTTGLTLSESLLDRTNTGDTNLNRSDVVERSRAEISWLVQAAAGRTSLRLMASFDRQDFQTLTGDEDNVEASADLRYRSSPRLTLGYAYQWREREPQEPTDASATDTDRTHRVNWRYTPNQRLNLALLVTYRQRESSAQVRDFRERTIGLALEYRI